jgi:hypothetical protein
MTLHVETTPGSGEWQGFDLLTVEVRAEPKMNVPIRVRLRGYVQEAEE